MFDLATEQTEYINIKKKIEEKQRTEQKETDGESLGRRREGPATATVRGWTVGSAVRLRVSE